jgi:RNA polymerase sigma-70 factor (ECF subfamily)
MVRNEVKISPALEIVWNQFCDQLCSFVRARAPNEDTAEDILQEVFIRIHTKGDTLRNADKLQSWVFQIARNALIDYYRSRRTTVELPQTLGFWEEDYEDDLAAELAADVREMVETLPEPYREALMLTAYEGLSQKELAKRLGLSYSGAKSRVQRARESVRDMLMACCHFELDRRGTVIDYYEHCCCCADEPHPG